MKIGIIGAGAMGMLFGSYLSRRNHVILIDVNQTRVEEINRQGILVVEADGSKGRYYPKAFWNTAEEKVDLLIVFVKAMYTEQALKANQGLIGSDTYVMSLQNGAGHEEKLKAFVAEDKIIIGMTQDNSSLIQETALHHGGCGKTFIGWAFARSWEGSLAERLQKDMILQKIAENFTDCGFPAALNQEIQKPIWNKLFLNVSASALTGVLQVKLGYVADNIHAWGLAKTLMKEAVAVANANHMDFEEDEVIEEVKQILEHSKDGCTSICADLRDGRKTEVDTISGAVVREGQKLNVPVPCHEFLVELVHALEERPVH